MAISSSITTTLIPSLATSPSFASKPTTTKLFSCSSLSLQANSFSSTLKLSTSTSRLCAAPETLDSQATLDPPLETTDEPDSDSFQIGDSETSSSPSISIAADADKLAPKQKIRIKLRSYWVPLIEDSCKQIMDAARNTNAKTMGPVPLPTKKRIYCVLKSPHVHKDARFHFEIRTHQRLIDILYPTAQTIDSLMQLDLPAGVDVEVKL
ncbi:30S ribosomal protein S10, chloroplastic [Ricinus communis]|uniref:Small ribosomal subunit protein uS10c n=1 Tax=Ricinus communis TaxID=3988 RepID=B9S9Q5_RICCO|nr:30S ribosomal protein S10, chloroplastic [Ricinus communis]EEF39575.1 30S ribosomal protein S10, putative [Ricinus communis]|eukprot:XP_002522724.1 30S ribosomal protein S10, chloroplastic [Ricinus communis]